MTNYFNHDAIPAEEDEVSTVSTPFRGLPLDILLTYRSLRPYERASPWNTTLFTFDGLTLRSVCAEQALAAQRRVHDFVGKSSGIELR
jgi:hypothetical protein